MNRRPSPWYLAIAACGAPEVAVAHASQQGLVLLLPTDAYLAAGTAVVALTVLLSFVLPARALERVFATRTVVRVPAHGHDRLPAASALSAIVFVALVFVGLEGPRDPLANLLPLTIWTLWWIGVPTLQSLCGDLWRRAQPWSAPLRLLAGRRGEVPARRPLPDAIGAWPAVLSLFGVNAFVLADPAPSDPERLALVASGYFAFTLAMAWRYGERDWLERGEAFTLMYSRFAELAPLRRGPRGVELGLPGHRLMHRDAPDGSLAAAYLVLLAAGSFDGLHETFAWFGWLGINPLDHPGRTALVGSTLAGLAALTLGIAVVYALATALGAGLVRDGPSAALLFRTLAPSLLPIAVAYHVAHYLTSFLVDAQYAVVAASDPLGDGRNLFGTTDRQVTTGFFNVPSAVRAIWLVQAGVVVLGHALAVLVAHGRALALFEGEPGASAKAVRAHVPLAVLMLGYTLFGLWLLASPRGV